MANHQNGTALVRPRYVPRLRVTAADLTADQDYVRERLRRHNRLLHGCGVICGLLVGLTESGEENLLQISPGSAISTLGDEIEVPKAVTLAAADFCFLEGEDASTRVRAAWPPPGHDPCPDGDLTDQVYYLGLCYNQTQSHPRSVLDGNCYENTACENTRLHDSYKFVLLDSIDPGADCVWIERNSEDPEWTVEGLSVDPARSATPALRYTRQIYFPSGRYRFSTAESVRSRLHIDGQTHIDRWADIDGPHTAEVLLKAGTHLVVVEFLGTSGNPLVHLLWEVLETGWYAEYFSYEASSPPPTLPTSGEADLVRIDPGIGFNWESGAPDEDVGANHFMARWMRDIDICLAGEYEFTALTDDGMRIYVDDQLILNAWLAQPATLYSPRVMLAPGPHRLRVEYYERAGGAVAQLNWRQVGPYNPSCAQPEQDGCVILATLTVSGGQIVRVDNYELNPQLGYRRKLLPSAGLLAEQIACLNRPQPAPAITQIVPGSGQRGSSLRALIFGSRLSGATAIAFAGAGVTANILPGGTDNWLPLEITITSTAALGLRAFSIRTPLGVIDSTINNVLFTVTGAPVVTTSPPTSTFTFTRPPFTLDPGATLTLDPRVTVTLDPRVTVTLDPRVTVTLDPRVTATLRPDEPFTRPGDLVTRPGGGVIDPGGIFVNPGGRTVVDTRRIPGGNLGRIMPGGIVGGDIGGLTGRASNNRPIGGDAGGVGNVVGGGISFEPRLGGETHPVTTVRGIGDVFAARLAEGGITTAEQVAVMEPGALAQQLGISEVRAMALIDAARRLQSE